MLKNVSTLIKDFVNIRTFEPKCIQMKIARGLVRTKGCVRKDIKSLVNTDQCVNGNLVNFSTGKMHMKLN